MGKRKRKRRTGAGPSLFDLPLQSTDGESDAGEADAESLTLQGGNEPPDTGGRGPTILFDEADGATGDGSQLDLLELGPDAERPAAEAVELTPDTRTAHDEPPDARAARDEPPDARTERDEPPDARTARDEPGARAFLGDRLLGGLADLAAQLIALGLAIAATHSMDIVVTVADWIPFGVLALVFSFLYWTVPLAFWGQTPGMAWVGHTARASNGEPLSFGQTFLRWLGSVVTLAFAGLPLLLALTGRSFTDRISDSRTAAG